MKAKQLKLTDWSRENPQRVGEYNASTVRDPDTLRWWNGKHWSLPYMPRDPEQLKRRCRRDRTRMTGIEWRGLVEEPHYPFPPGPLGKL